MSLTDAGAVENRERDFDWRCEGTFPQVEAGDQNHEIYRNHRISPISVSGNQKIATGGTLHEYR